MKISIAQPQTVSSTRFTEPEFDMFQSLTVIDGKEYTFSRHVEQLNWIFSTINVNGENIGFGEDPRAFDFFGMPACYSVRFREHERFTPQLYFNDGDSWNKIDIHMEDGSDPGKNWGPFVYNGALHFVHSVSPFTVLRVEGDTATKILELPVKASIHAIDRYPALRSGSNGLEVADGIIVGFGHDNYVRGSTIFDIWHKPFAWTLDMEAGTVEIQEFADYPWHQDGFKIIDASSFFKKDGRYYLMTAEGETNQAQPDQEFRSVIREINLDL